MMWGFFSGDKDAAKRAIGTWGENCLHHKVRVLCKVIAKLKRRSSIVARHNQTARRPDKVLDFDLHKKLKPWYDFMLEVLRVSGAPKHTYQEEGNYAVERYKNENGVKSRVQAEDDNMSVVDDRAGVEAYLLPSFYKFAPGKECRLDVSKARQIKHEFGHVAFEFAFQPWMADTRAKIEYINIQACPHSAGQYMTHSRIRYNPFLFDEKGERALQKVLNFALCFLKYFSEATQDSVLQNIQG